MTDRELIEAAAEAGGMPPWTWDEESGCINCQHRSDLTNMHFWNPLTDDGDALRLAVKLGMQVYAPDTKNSRAAVHVDNAVIDATFTADGSSDPAAATRRVIVAAAAEIGRRSD